MPKDSKYKWFSNVRRFRNRAGRFVSSKNVGEYVDVATNNFAKQLKIDTQKMIDNFSEERFSAWATKARRDIVNMHNAVTIIALGGKKAAVQFSSRNVQVWTEAESLAASQVRFFDRKMFGAAVGALQLNKAFADQVSMYGEAGVATYENAVRLREATAGMNEEARIRNSGQPCDDCTIESLKGYVPIGTLRRIGDSKCGGRCRCRFVFRKSVK